MKILVIGGNRFFGRRFSELMVSAQHEVWLLNRGSKPVEGTRLLRGSRTSPEDLRRAVKESNSEAEPFDAVVDQVCMSRQDAELAVQELGPFAKRWVHTSTQSVYGPGPEIVESDFVALDHKFEPTVEIPPYPEAKRQAESVLERARLAGQLKSLTVMRIPIVLGEDDYTERLLWHIRRIRRKEPMIVPNPEARLNFIHSSEAAHCLKAFCEGEPGSALSHGAFNCASPNAISVGQILKLIEGVTRETAILRTDGEDSTHSPFGLSSDWVMSTDKLERAGVHCRPLELWLPKLVETLNSSIL